MVSYCVKHENNATVCLSTHHLQRNRTLRVTERILIFINVLLHTFTAAYSVAHLQRSGNDMYTVPFVSCVCWAKGRHDLGFHSAQWNAQSMCI